MGSKNPQFEFATSPNSQTTFLSSPMAVLGLFILLLVSNQASIALSGDEGETLSAYLALQQYDFPVGLLPKGVIRYELNRETGEFKAYLNSTCSFPIESYELQYKSTVTGKISKDRITNLKGVSVKVLFLWLNIVEVIRSGDEIEFSVGIASADFPIDNFLESPQCGCGLDCNNRLKLKRQSLRSSY